MSAINRVRAMMAKPEKVELSKIEIDLAIVADIKKLSKEANSYIKKADSLISKLEKAQTTYTALQKDAKQSASLAKSFSTGVGSLVSRAKTAAKELGVNVNDIDGIKALESVESELKSTENILGAFPPIN